MKSFSELLSELPKRFSERYVDLGLRLDTLKLFPAYFSRLLNDDLLASCSVTLEQAESVVEGCYVVIASKYPVVTLNPGNPIPHGGTAGSVPDLPRPMLWELGKKLHEHKGNQEKLRLLPADSEPKPHGFVHSDDYRSIKFRGKNYSLTTNQALIVQALDEARERGYGAVSKDSLLDRMGSSTSRIRDSFRRGDGAELWGTLIVKTPNRRDMYSLNLPER